MGSVAKRYCARDTQCTQYATLGQPTPLRKSSKNALCEPCQRKYAEGYPSEANARWVREVVLAIETVRPGKASLWDLFELNPHNGGRDWAADRGKVLACLDSKTLDKIRGWIGDNIEEAMERYGFVRPITLRTEVGLTAWLRRLPPDMSLLPNKQDGFPLQGVAIREDGKTWDLNAPIRARLLQEWPRYFSERDRARLTGMSRSSYKRMEERMERLGFTLDKFSLNELPEIRLPKKPGPKSDSDE